MNTQEFKNFKLHADSTLKSMKKEELIAYIHMLHHNWKACDEQMCNVMDYNLEIHKEIERLESALDKACEELERDVLFFKDLNFTKGIVQDSYTKEEWKEWCMKDE